MANGRPVADPSVVSLPIGVTPTEGFTGFSDTLQALGRATADLNENLKVTDQLWGTGIERAKVMLNILDTQGGKSKEVAEFLREANENMQRLDHIQRGAQEAAGQVQTVHGARIQQLSTTYEHMATGGQLMNQGVRNRVQGVLANPTAEGLASIKAMSEFGGLPGMNIGMYGMLGSVVPDIEGALKEGKSPADVIEKVGDKIVAAISDSGNKIVETTKSTRQPSLSAAAKQELEGIGGDITKSYQEEGFKALEQYLPSGPGGQVIREKASGLFSKLGGLGGAGGMAAKLALGGVGAGLAGYGAYTGVIEPMLQRANEYTQITGGTSVGESLGFEWQARTMAASPFLNVEQSREIVQETLRTGYGGRRYETLVDFVAQNVKEGTYDIADSIELYKDAVRKSGSSIQEVDFAVQGLRGTARDTHTSLSELTSGFKGTVSTLSEGGFGSAVAPMAGWMTQLFAQAPSGLKGMVPQIGGGGFIDLQLATALQAQGMEGVTPFNVVAQLGQFTKTEGAQATGQVYYDAVRQGVARIAGFSEDATAEEILASPYGAQMLVQGFQAMGLPEVNTQQKAAALWESMRTGGPTTPRGAEARLEKQYRPQRGAPSLRGEFDMPSMMALGGGESGAYALASNRSAEDRYRILYGRQQVPTGAKAEYDIPLYEQLMGEDKDFERLVTVNEKGDIERLEDYVRREGEDAWKKIRAGTIKTAFAGEKRGDIADIVGRKGGARLGPGKTALQFQTLAERYGATEESLAAGSQAEQGRIGLTDSAAKLVVMMESPPLNKMLAGQQFPEAVENAIKEAQYPYGGKKNA